MPPTNAALTGEANSTPRDFYSGLPTWVKVVFALGFPSVIAGYLIVNSTKTQAAQATALNTLSTAMTEHVEASKSHDVRMSEFLRIHEQFEQSNRLVLIQLCSQGAKTVADRAACRGELPAGPPATRETVISANPQPSAASQLPH